MITPRCAKAVLLFSSVWLRAAGLHAQPADGGVYPMVIPTGQEALITAMMNPARPTAHCALDEARVDRTYLTASYRCANQAAPVTIEARHPEVAPAGATRTEQFALTPGPGTPPELFAVVVAQVRAAERRWRWVRPHPNAPTGPDARGGDGGTGPRLTDAQSQQFQAGLAQYRDRHFADALATYLAMARDNACCGVLGMVVASLASTAPGPAVADRYAAEAAAAPDDALKQFVAGVAAHYAAHQAGRSAEEKARLYARAIEHLARAQETFNREPRVFIYLAVSHFRLGHQAEAESFIERAVALGGEDPDTFYCRAEIFQRTNIRRSIQDIDRYLAMMVTLERQGAVSDPRKSERVRAMRAHLVAVSEGDASREEIFDPVTASGPGDAPFAPSLPSLQATRPDARPRPASRSHNPPAVAHAAWARRIGLGVLLVGVLTAVLQAMRQGARARKDT